MATERFPRPGSDLISRILAAGADAARLAVQAGHGALSGGVARYVEAVRAEHPEVGTEELVERVVKAHIVLARAEGAAAGFATTTAMATTVVGSAGTLTIPAATVITATDLTGLAWIQLRMSLMIAALYGHDPTDNARIKEFLHLQGAMPAAAAGTAARSVATAAGRVSTRLLNRHLTGGLLKAVTGLMRIAGVRFSRAVVIRNLFVLNIPANVFVNRAATRRFADKAREYYRTLPPDLPPRVREPRIDPPRLGSDSASLATPLQAN